MFILDLETVRDAIGTIKQIRESAPTSKIVLLCGFEDKDRTREAFVYGVDGVVVNVQPPGVMLATIEALYAPAPHRVQAEHNGAVWVELLSTSKQKVDSPTQPPAWAEALTERERLSDWWRKDCPTKTSPTNCRLVTVQSVII